MWLSGRMRRHDGFVHLEMRLQGRAERGAGTSQLPERPRQHSPDLGQSFRADHQERDDEDDQDLLQAAAELKHLGLLPPPRYCPRRSVTRSTMIDRCSRLCSDSCSYALELCTDAAGGV